MSGYKESGFIIEFSKNFCSLFLSPDSSPPFLPVLCHPTFHVHVTCHILSSPSFSALLFPSGSLLSSFPEKVNFSMSSWTSTNQLCSITWKSSMKQLKSLSLNLTSLQRGQGHCENMAHRINWLGLMKKRSGTLRGLN